MSAKVRNYSFEVEVVRAQEGVGLLTGTVTFKGQRRGVFPFSAALTATRDDDSLWRGHTVAIALEGFVEHGRVHVESADIGGRADWQQSHHARMDEALHLEAKATINGLQECVLDAYRVLEETGLAKPLACPSCGGERCTSCAARIYHDECADDCPRCCDSSAAVLVLAPSAGDAAPDAAYGRRAVADCLARGESPHAPHLLLAGVVDVSDALERESVLRAGLAFVSRVDRVVAYEDHGVSNDMQVMIDRAQNAGVPLERRTIGLSADALSGRQGEVEGADGEGPVR